MTLYPDIKATGSYPNEIFEKNFKKNRLANSNLNLLKLGKRKHASYEMVNEWVMDAWKHVATDEKY